MMWSAITVLSSDELHKLQRDADCAVAGHRGVRGQTVRVSGELKGGAIMVKKFEVKKGDGWQEILLHSVM